MNKIMWWGYLHSNKTIQLKRWFEDIHDYTTDCIGNEFVLKVVPTFEASTHEEAMNKLKQEIIGYDRLCN